MRIFLFQILFSLVLCHYGFSVNYRFEDSESASLDFPKSFFQDSHDFLQKGETNSMHPFRFLVFGGGNSPPENQFSLESNVRYFMRIRERIGVGEAPLDLFFADGIDQARDLQFNDPEYQIPTANLALAKLFGKSSGIRNQYRNNLLASDGQSSLDNLDAWFEERGNSTEKQINLVYFTGHGGKGKKSDPKNTSVLLWNDEKLNMIDLSEKLDSMPPQQTFLFVMVQCYAGGFANLMFREGIVANGLSMQPRAGFFATTYDRVAAGCTPDIRESNYSEYSTQFWEALCGINRMGEEVLKPDYDGNGLVSLAEAHSYVIIHSDTIDVPVKTSDVWLRNVFSPGFDKRETEGNQSSGYDYKKDDLDLRELFLRKINKARKIHTEQAKPIISDLISHFAEAEEREVFQKLSEVLKIKGDFPLMQLHEKKILLDGEKNILDKSKKDALNGRKKIYHRLKRMVGKKYPELQNPFHPKVTEILCGPEGRTFKELIKEENLWEDLLSKEKEVEKWEAEKFRIQKKLAKIMRLKRCIEYVWLTQLLESKGSFRQQSDFFKLVKLERTQMTK